MNRDKLIALLESMPNKPVLVAGSPSMPVTDVIATPRAIVLWPSLEEEQEDSLLNIDVMQDEYEQWRLVLYDKLNRRTLMVGRPYNDLLEAESLMYKCFQNIDDFTVAFSKGLDEVNSFLNQLEHDR